MKQTNKLVRKSFTFHFKIFKINRRKHGTQGLYSGSLYIYIYMPNFENYFFVYN